MSEPEPPDDAEPEAPDDAEPGAPDAEPDTQGARDAAASTPGGESSGATSPRRLDPMRAAAAAGGADGGRPTRIEPVIDIRRYQWMIGIVGVSIVIIFSVYLFLQNGITTPGVSPGSRLHNFVAPLATSGVNLPANADPHCNPAKPNLKGLNVCGRRPLVLAFFVTNSTTCVREVDTLQRLSGEFPQVQFAAVAVHGNVKSAAKLERKHHWTIQIGVDSDGRVGEIYGIEICPLVEIARRGGIVVKRLIGNGWANPARLASQVRALSTPPPATLGG
jgi:hypothetical protein